MREDLLELINRRRRQIVLHSYIYYCMNDNIVTDSVYDAWCNELVKLQKENPEESKAVEYFYKEFKEFDGSTGFHLANLDNSSHDRALRLMRYIKENS